MTNLPALTIDDAPLRAVVTAWLAAPSARAFFSLADDAALQLRRGGDVLVLYDDTQWLDSYAMPLRLGQLLDNLRQTLARRGDAALAAVRLSPRAVLDARNQQLQHDGRIISLTGREVDILLYLQRSSTPLNKEQLLTEVWGYHPEMTTHTVETHMWRLRQKIETDPEQPAILITVPDGYTLAR